jgi:NADH-quinone oxidoreductase subunit N
MSGFPTNDFLALLPVGILTLGALIVLLSEVFLVSGKRAYQALLIAVTAGVAGAMPFWLHHSGTLFGGQATADDFSAFVTVTVCASLALSALVGTGWLEARRAERGEFYALAAFAAAGMCLLGMASDLLLAFVAIEVMSLATYALAAYLRRGRRPSEAAFKYLVLGAFSSALFLYGSALLYGATGSTLFATLTARPGHEAIFVAGLGMVVAGLAFKIAAVPFHMWTPDVYEGAPTPVTAFMAAGVKTAAFALLARVLQSSWAGMDVTEGRALFGVLAVLAALSMVGGNLLALPQRSVKRMLAYSSIAHAGYLLVGVMASLLPGGRDRALAGLLFYLASYAASAIGAFAVVGAVERRSHGEDEAVDAWDLSRFAGLARTRPALALAMAVFLLSLAGIPPTGGFVGKLYVFQAAIGSGSAEMVALAVFGILTSALGAYYYLRVVVYMYMRPSEGESEVLSAPATSVALVAAVAVVVLLGLAADPVVRLAQSGGALGL